MHSLVSESGRQADTQAGRQGVEVSTQNKDQEKNNKRRKNEE